MFFCCYLMPSLNRVPKTATLSELRTVANRATFYQTKISNNSAICMRSSNWRPNNSKKSRVNLMCLIPTPSQTINYPICRPAFALSFSSGGDCIMGPGANKTIMMDGQNSPDDRISWLLPNRNTPIIAINNGNTIIACTSVWVGT